jgi:hypothetical protein
MLLTCENPAAPVACGTIPQQVLHVGESATVAACFNDADGDALRYSVSSSDPGVATATSAGGRITIVAASPGEARISVVAADRTGRSAQQSFDVLVPNRPPVVVRDISGFVGSVGSGAIVVDLSRHFSDPDGEVLDYTAEFDPAIVQISIDAEWMTILNIAKGTVTVVVTATDPGGLKVTDSFPVTAPNRPPLSAGTVPGQTIEVGDTSGVVVGPHFTDPDGDALSFSVVTTDTLVATTAVRDSVVAVTGVAKGSATVTVTATDTEGLKASLSFAVTVPNRGPVVVDAIPGLTMGVGREAAMELGSYFGDPDGDGLAFAAVAADSAVVAISVDRGSVTLTAISKGESMVTVTATDTEGLAATCPPGTSTNPSTWPPSVPTTPSPMRTICSITWPPTRIWTSFMTSRLSASSTKSPAAPPSSTPTWAMRESRSRFAGTSTSPCLVCASTGAGTTLAPRTAAKRRRRSNRSGPRQPSQLPGSRPGGLYSCRLLGRKGKA